jgi:mannose-6-phosphate isomerase-like protein (cupin superfamily)
LALLDIRKLQMAPGDPDMPVSPSRESAQLLLPCADLNAALGYYCDGLGFRLDMIMPADAPREALLSGYGLSLRLQQAGIPLTQRAMSIRLPRSRAPDGLDTRHEHRCPDGHSIEWFDSDQAPAVPPVSQDLVISCHDGADAWVRGRAGMHYRDLIPGRLGGSFIASHIRIPDGGPVPDYVHFHKVRLQLIYCRRGWVRVVYEDQGAAFVMYAGDCVLQPPTIRHRVLEASDGLEVVEVGCPAEHETWREHQLALPNPTMNPERLFEQQRFTRHVAANAGWHAGAGDGIEVSDLGIAHATGGFADVRVLRLRAGSNYRARHDGEFRWCFVLGGHLELHAPDGRSESLASDDSSTIPASADYRLHALEASELLQVSVSRS